jgi:flagellar protein FliO/FliZ
VLACAPAFAQQAARDDALPDEATLPIGGGDEGGGAPGGSPSGAASPASAPMAAPLLSTWDFLRMILILGAVVGVIYGLFFLLKKSRGRRTVENGLIRMLGSRSLSGSRSLHLVEVGRSVFLVGSAEGGISLISELKDRETIDQVRLEGSRAVITPLRSFSSILAGLFRPAPPAPGRDSPAASSAAAAGESIQVRETAEYIKKQQERLKRM